MLCRIPRARAVRTLGARSLSASCVQRNLFGGSKTIHPAPNLKAPSGKGESAPDPVDLLKRNDMLMHSQKPRNNIELVRANGFLFSSGVVVTSPDKTGAVTGVVLLDSDVFEVNLDEGYTITNGFLVAFEPLVLSVFSRIHPKPEIVVVGLGKRLRVLSEENRRWFLGLGIQVEVLDSNNAAQIFDLLATERPMVVGGLMMPPNV